MDILDRLLGHDAWTTRQVLLLCQGLNDEQLDRDFDIGHRTLRATWVHLIGNIRVWTDLMAERSTRTTPRPVPWATSPATLLAAWEEAMAEFTRLAHQLAADGRLDDSYIDTLDNPPKRKTFGGTIAHLLTHDMHHRGEILHILQRLGVPDLPEGDVLGWEATAPPTARRETVGKDPAIGRIIPEIRSRDFAATREFYCDLLGLEVGMEDDPFLMLNSRTNPSAQLTVNDNGHPRLPPGFAIEVEDAERVRALHAEMQRRGLAIVEPLEDKPWGIRRFSVVDPNGVRVTVISHIQSPAEA